MVRRQRKRNSNGHAASVSALASVLPRVLCVSIACKVSFIFKSWSLLLKVSLICVEEANHEEQCTHAASDGEKLHTQAFHNRNKSYRVTQRQQWPEGACHPPGRGQCCPGCGGRSALAVSPNPLSRDPHAPQPFLTLSHGVPIPHGLFGVHVSYPDSKSGTKG